MSVLNFLSMSTLYIPRHTIPLLVVVVAAYDPVLSGNVGGVDIVNCSCQNLVLLVILSVHMSTVLYYLQGVALHIESSHVMHRSEHRWPYVRTYQQYVQICSTFVWMYVLTFVWNIYLYTNIIVSCVRMCLSHLFPHCTVHLVGKPVLDWC